MTAEVFLDSNVLLYACSAAPADANKQAIAERLILETDFALSAQVLQEFVTNALRKKNLGISESGIDATLELSGHVPVLPSTSTNTSPLIPATPNLSSKTPVRVIFAVFADNSRRLD